MRHEGPPTLSSLLNSPPCEVELLLPRLANQTRHEPNPNKMHPASTKIIICVSPQGLPLTSRDGGWGIRTITLLGTHIDSGTVCPPTSQLRVRDALLQTCSDPFSQLESQTTTSTPVSTNVMLQLSVTLSYNVSLMDNDRPTSTLPPLRGATRGRPPLPHLPRSSYCPPPNSLALTSAIPGSPRIL